MKLNEIVHRADDRSVRDFLTDLFGPHDPDTALDSGSLNCYSKSITSLVGCPKTLRGNFDCSSNLLTSLKGGPTSVGKDYICQQNFIDSLDGAPSFIGGDFICSWNRLTSLKDIHKHIKEIKGNADFEGCPIKGHVLGLLKIKNLQTVDFSNVILTDIINKYLPEGDMLACIDELEDAGFEEYAKL